MPLRTVIGLVVSGTLGAALSFVMLYLTAIGHMNSRDPLSNESVGSILALSYGFCGLLGAVLMVAASRRAVRLYILGIAIMCAGAAATPFMSGLMQDRYMFIAMVWPAITSLVVTSVIGARATLTIRFQEKDKEGNPTLGRWSLAIAAVGYTGWLVAPMTTAASLAVLSSAVAVWLARRAMPNICAIIALVLSVVLILVVLTLPRWVG